MSRKSKAAGLGHLGARRAAMPQVKRRHFRTFLAWLRARGIPFEILSVPASSLEETQRDLDAEKVQRTVARAASDEDWARERLGFPVISSADGFVMDGHHRLAARRMLSGRSALVPTCRVGVGIVELVRLAGAFPLTSRPGLRRALPGRGRRVAVLSADGRAFTAEVASTPAAVAEGLMGRTVLPPDHGMLFLFPAAERHAFWMRGTPIPLSVAFLRDDGTVVGTEDMAPFSEDRHAAPEPVRVALEMPLGWFSARGVAVGSRIRIADPGEGRS